MAESNSFISGMLYNNAGEQATTWNGAASYATTSTISAGGALVNYLFKALRSAPEDSLRRLWISAAAEDKMAAHVLLFFTRDRFRGKGERLPFVVALKHMVNNGELAQVERWYPLISYFGYPKDLFCLLGTAGEDSMLRFYCAVLQEDFRRMNTKLPVTTLGKFAPTEGGSFDKKFQCVAKMCKIMGCSKKYYRKTMIGPLRRYMDVPERRMCLGEWHSINYSGVPSRSMFIHKKAFARHAPEKWAEYEKQLADGTAKVNSKVFPHDLCYKILQGRQPGFDQTDQSMWDTLKKKTLEEFLEFDLSGVMIMGDTSGSMTAKINNKTSVRCLDVSVGLGLFFAELLPAPWKDTIMTFSSHPTFHKAVGSTLYERLSSLSRAKWEMSTNLQAGMDLMLNTALRNSVPAKDMPSILLIISDMQFNPTWNGNTNLVETRRKFEAAGYAMPNVVFWNVLGSTSDYPAQADMNSVGMLSGFSPTILRLVFSGEINPVSIVKRAISDPRYEVIRQAETEAVDWKEFLYTDFGGGAEKKRRTENEAEPMDVDEDDDEDEEVKVVVI